MWALRWGYFTGVAANIFVIYAAIDFYIATYTSKYPIDVCSGYPNNTLALAVEFFTLFFGMPFAGLGYFELGRGKKDRLLIAVMGMVLNVTPLIVSFELGRIILHFRASALYSDCQ